MPEKSPWNTWIKNGPDLGYTAKIGERNYVESLEQGPPDHRHL